MSSTSTVPPTREATLEEQIHMTNSFNSFLHYTSLTMLVAAPVLIALPPRKLDLYTFFLSGSMFASANHLVKERTGAGMLYQLPGVQMPAAAIEYQERMGMRRVQAPTRLLDEQSTSRGNQTFSPEELEKKGVKMPRPGRDTVGAAAKEDWKKQRLAEEQSKLDEGEGYSDIIVDQIWEVWNWGEKKAEEIKEKDEEVVDKRKREERREEEFPTIGRGS